MGYASYLIVTPIFTGIVLYLLIMVRGYKQEPLGISLNWYLWGVLGFLVFSYLELSAETLEWILLFASFQHLSLPIIAVSWFYFSLFYTGIRENVDNRGIWILCLVPLLDFVFCITNNLHHQYYVSMGIKRVGDIVIMQPQYGPLFWITTFYLYCLFFTGVFFIFRGYLKGDSFYRRQAGWVVVGFILPMIVNFIYIFKWIPWFRKDYTPVAFAATGVFFFISIYWEKLLKLSPLSRNIILRDVPVGVITLNQNLEVIDFNPLASTYTGVSKQHMGCSVLGLAFGQAVLQKYPEYFENKERNVNLDYLHRTLEIKLSYIHLQNRSAYLIVLQDSTEKHKLIKKLEETNVELVRMQNELIQQKKMAVIGQMAAGVAHEINNPVSFIKSNQLMQERYLDKLEASCHESEPNHKILVQIKELNQESEEGMRRISNVVQNLLSFSRTGTNAERKAYNLNQEIEKTVLLLGNKIRQRIQIIYDLEDLPEILCSGNEINQVLLNLLTNATQAIPEDELGHITIHTEIRNDRIVCEIGDSGAMIPERIKNTLFDPFFTTKAGGKGTGLGLSLSKDIIEKRHKGSLYLKEGPTKAFCFELPIVLPEELTV